MEAKGERWKSMTVPKRRKGSLQDALRAEADRVLEVHRRLKLETMRRQPQWFEPVKGDKEEAI
jgi:hypothetical protein